MALTYAILMDPIESITVYKDSTLAMMLEIQRRGHTLFYFKQADMEIRDGKPFAFLRPVKVWDDEDHWFEEGEGNWQCLGDMNVIMDRKDPPVNSKFFHDTLVLELTQQVPQGAHKPLLVNPTQGLRDCNEKLYAMQFPQCIAPTLVSRNMQQIKAFAAKHGEIVLKPLDGMGGKGIFRVVANDTNLTSMLETLLGDEQQFVMAQKYVPEISAGDKRILILDGEAVPYALARIPQQGEFRGNLAAGGRGEGRPLSARDQWIVDQVAPDLKRRGLIFVGLDVIGDYLTEINVTSPTCIRELDAQYDLNIAATLLDAIEKRL